jgi:hypothetical protein
MAAPTYVKCEGEENFDKVCELFADPSKKHKKDANYINPWINEGVQWAKKRIEVLEKRLYSDSKNEDVTHTPINTAPHRPVFIDPPAMAEPLMPTTTVWEQGQIVRVNRIVGDWTHITADVWNEPAREAPTITQAEVPTTNIVTLQQLNEIGAEIVLTLPPGERFVDPLPVEVPIELRNVREEIVIGVAYPDGHGAQDRFNEDGYDER